MRYIFFIVCLFFSFNVFAGPSPEMMKKRMLSDLDFIKGTFEVKYAPTLWKKTHANWELEKAYVEAKSKVQALPKPTVKDYQIILKEFFQSVRDYHVGVSFFSTETASLPFVVRGANHRYFIVDFDEDEFPSSIVSVGDEIVKFNGQPIDLVIQDLKKKEVGMNEVQTDQAMAELLLTTRDGARGHVIPKGDVTIEVLRKNGDKVAVALKWHYHKERISDVAKPKQTFTCQSPYLTSFEKKDIRPDWHQFFNKMMVAANFCDIDKTAHSRMSPHYVGARTSFIPPLGKKLWETDGDNFYDAYIFDITDPAILPENKKSLRVGYVRLAHFMADEDEAAQFQKLISFFQAKTDALVIDQINNPGGSLFYLYALSSMLTDKPMTVPKHHIALTQEEVQMAVMILSVIDVVTDDETAKAVFGESIGGYPIDYQFVLATKEFCRFLISEWDAGNIYSNPIHLFGVDMIRPHPTARYTKPLLVLINSLDYSCADFFPATLQDNKRATLLGTRTAGAGGFVFGTRYPNLIGVSVFSLTGSHALRCNKCPIENLGVTPDVAYDLTEKDFQGNYKPYVDTILHNICSLCGKK